MKKAKLEITDVALIISIVSFALNIILTFI